MTSSLARSLAANWVALAVNSIVGLIVPAMVVRSLGAEAYGVWALAVSIAGHMALLDFGCRHAIVRYVALFRGSADFASISRLISSTVSLMMWLSWVGIAAMTVLSWYLPHFLTTTPDLLLSAQLLLLVLAIDGALDLISGPFSSALGGAERYDVLQTLNTIRLLLNGVLAAFFLWLGWGLWGVAAALILSRLAHRLAIFGALKKVLPAVAIRKASYDGALLRQLFSYSAWTALMVASARISYQIDLAVIGFVLGATAVTNYALPLLLIDQMRALCDSASLVLLSRLSAVAPDKWSDNGVELLDRWSRYAPLLPLTVGLHLVFFGDAFITLWIGREVPDSRSVISLLALPFFVSAPAAAYTTTLLARGKPAIAARLQLVEAVLNVTLSLALVERFGVVGVAAGTCIPTIVIQGLVTPWVTREITGYRWGDHLRNAYLHAGLIAAGYAMVLHCTAALVAPRSILSFLLANGIPFVALIAFLWLRYLDPHDRKYIARRFTRSA